MSHLTNDGSVPDDEIAEAVARMKRAERRRAWAFVVSGLVLAVIGVLVAVAISDQVGRLVNQNSVRGLPYCAA
jgi:hypothetical protein